jgi:hypothetical protein
LFCNRIHTCPLEEAEEEEEEEEEKHTIRHCGK